jgi:hypothetical protein
MTTEIIRLKTILDGYFNKLNSIAAKSRRSLAESTTSLIIFMKKEWQLYNMLI